MEKIHRLIEVRAAADRREIAGVVVDYRDRSPSHRESFAPGSVTVAAAAILDLEHDRMKALCWRGAGLEFEDGPERLEFSATIPPIPLGDAALAGLRGGGLIGASIEFEPISTRREGATTIVEQAVLHGVALTARPSYPLSEVQLRRARAVAASAVLL